MNGLRSLFFGLLLLLPACGLAETIVFDFENLPLGQQFGSPVGDMPGDVILTQPGAELSVEILEDGGFSGPFFGGVEVHDFSGRARSLELNNVSIEVAFVDPAEVVRHVRLNVFEVLPRSQFVTIQVNGGGLLVGGDALAFDSVTPDGVLVNSSFNALPSITSAAIDIIATGEQSIESVRIGSALLFIDAVAAYVVPEPSAVLILIVGFILPVAVQRR